MNARRCFIESFSRCYIESECLKMGLSADGSECSDVIAIADEFTDYVLHRKKRLLNALLKLQKASNILKSVAKFFSFAALYFTIWGFITAFFHFQYYTVFAAAMFLLSIFMVKIFKKTEERISGRVKRAVKKAVSAYFTFLKNGIFITNSSPKSAASNIDCVITKIGGSPKSIKTLILQEALKRGCKNLIGTSIEKIIDSEKPMYFGIAFGYK